VADDPEETVGQRVRRLRLERGLSQHEIAVPGVSYAYVSRIEAGQRIPSLKTIRALARRLGVTPDTSKPASPSRPPHGKNGGSPTPS